MSGYLSKLVILPVIFLYLQSASADVIDTSTAAATQSTPVPTSTAPQVPGSTNTSNPVNQPTSPNPNGELKVNDVVMFKTGSIGCSSENELLTLAGHLADNEIDQARAMFNNIICGVITATAERYRVVDIKMISTVVLIEFVNVKDVNATTGYWTLSKSIKEKVN